ncbi:hypothetical protein KPL70_001052 [Citrus sinensis]|nr:hypothetical protein KPL70_001052 [Citrus sinensis]
MSLNSKAMNALFCALDKKEFHRVSSCESAQEIWNKLEVVYKGTNQVKDSKISRYTCQYELFQIEQNEKDLATEKCNEEKKKSIALKASKYESDGESEPDDEELAMLARRFRKIFKKIGERRKFRNLKNQKEKKEVIICYECKKPGHIRSECPLLNKLKKKAMVATWDDSDEDSSDEEESQEVSNLALMAVGDDDDLNEGLKKKKNKWYLDNGCSRHMTGNYAWFSSFTKIENGGDVSFGDNSKGKILGIGNVEDNLGKFDPKSDVGIFLGYSNSSKAYRVYNKRTLDEELQKESSKGNQVDASHGNQDKQHEETNVEQNEGLLTPWKSIVRAVEALEACLVESSSPWAVELGEHDIKYQPRTTIKGQAATYFIAEFTSNQFKEARINEAIIPTGRLYVDGSSNQQWSGAGLILVTPEHTEISFALRFGFKASNNKAEYEALLAGLRLTKEMGAEKLEIFSDSQLIVNEVISEY